MGIEEYKGYRVHTSWDTEKWGYTFTVFDNKNEEIIDSGEDAYFYKENAHIAGQQALNEFITSQQKENN